MTLGSYNLIPEPSANLELEISGDRIHNHVRRTSRIYSLNLESRYAHSDIECARRI